MCQQCQKDNHTKPALVLALALALGSCGRSPEVTTTYEDTSPLPAQVALYRKESPASLDYWLKDREQCDALLFASLTEVGLKRKNGMINRFELSPGHFARRPDVTVCDSYVSRDMLTGLFAYIYYSKDLEMAERVYQYAMENNGYMGAYPASNRDIQTMTPNLFGQLARIIYALGGKDHPERHLPALRVYVVGGYQAHLAVVSIAVESDIARGLSTLDKIYLQHVVDDSPTNLLALALLSKYDHDYEDAFLEAAMAYPIDRLPGSEDWCEPWRTQRQDGDKGLTACPEENKTHSGGDFLFAVFLKGF